MHRIFPRFVTAILTTLVLCTTTTFTALADTPQNITRWTTGWTRSGQSFARTAAGTFINYFPDNDFTQDLDVKKHGTTLDITMPLGVYFFSEEKKDLPPFHVGAVRNIVSTIPVRESFTADEYRKRFPQPRVWTEIGWGTQYFDPYVEEFPEAVSYLLPLYLSSLLHNNEVSLYPNLVVSLLKYRKHGHRGQPVVTLRVTPSAGLPCRLENFSFHRAFTSSLSLGPYGNKNYPVGSPTGHFSLRGYAHDRKSLWMQATLEENTCRHSISAHYYAGDSLIIINHGRVTVDAIDYFPPLSRGLLGAPNGKATLTFSPHYLPDYLS